jgi:hypothetical protein
MEYLDARARSDGDIDALVLVHAILVGPSGDRFAHAWVEDGPIVVDAGMLDGGERAYYAAERAEYYGARTIEITTRYTPRQAYELNRRSGHFGPWEPAYQELCGGRGVFGACTLRRVLIERAAK